MVNVDYRPLKNQIRPKDHIDVIRPLLPAKYSPLQQSGNGNQGVYLARIETDLAEKLLDLIGEDTKPAISEAKEHNGESKTDREAAEDRIEKSIKKSTIISNTEKETLVKARRGQGKFREDVLSKHIQCPFTGIRNPNFLKAGHLKPWSKCTNRERIDPLNGLPLSPVADLLIDQGLVSFDEAGIAIFSPIIDTDELKSMGIDSTKKFNINIRNDDHRKFIDYHRKNIFKRNETGT